MARTDFPANDPLAVKIWSARLQKALPKNSWFMKSGFVGKDPTQNVIVVMDDLKGKYGDQITYGIRQQLRGYSTPGDQQLKPNIQKNVFLDDKIVINQQRAGVNSGGKMANQRVPYDLQSEAKDSQVDYWGVRLDEEIIGKLCGALGVGAWETINPNASGTDVVGAIDSDGNALRAPSTNRIVWSGVGTKVGLTAGDTFSLDAVDTALRKVTRLQMNATTKRKMAPLRIGGKNVWILLMDLTHAFDLKKNIGQRWGQIELAKIQGSFKDSALAQQSLGVYESAAGSVMLFSHEGMPKFQDGGAGANVLYASSLLMGQSAGTFAPATEMNDGMYVTWHEESVNSGNEVEISSGLIYGFQKSGYLTAPASGVREDYGVCVIQAASNWAA